jgi:co-chaperonin GroES (HSP10)
MQRNVSSLKPIGNRVLVELIPPEQQVSPSGVVLSAPSSSDKVIYNTGRVLAVGEGRTLASGEVKPIANIAVNDVVQWQNFVEKDITVCKSANGLNLAVVLVDDIFVNFGGDDNG